MWPKDAENASGISHGDLNGALSGEACSRVGRLAFEERSPHGLRSRTAWPIDRSSGWPEKSLTERHSTGGSGAGGIPRARADHHRTPWVGASRPHRTTAGPPRTSAAATPCGGELARSQRRQPWTPARADSGPGIIDKRPQPPPSGPCECARKIFFKKFLNLNWLQTCTEKPRKFRHRCINETENLCHPIE